MISVASGVTTSPCAARAGGFMVSFCEKHYIQSAFKLKKSSFDSKTKNKLSSGVNGGAKKKSHGMPEVDEVILSSKKVRSSQVTDDEEDEIVLSPLKKENEKKMDLIKKVKDLENEKRTTRQSLKQYNLMKKKPDARRRHFSIDGDEDDCQMCHQCMRSTLKVVRCRNGCRKRYCVACIQKWYPELLRKQYQRIVIVVARTAIAKLV